MHFWTSDACVPLPPKNRSLLTPVLFWMVYSPNSISREGQKDSPNSNLSSFWLLESPNSSQLTFNRSVGFWSFILHLGTLILWFFESHTLFNLWLASSRKLITMTGQSLIWTIQCSYFFTDLPLRWLSCNKN